jgi:hypothetical protein
MYVVPILSRWRERFDSARERHHHVANTFKAQGDHFQGLREPFSQPKFHPLHNPGNGHQCVRMRNRENGYGRYCNHDLRRALPRTPRNVAGLLSTGYLTDPHGDYHMWGLNVARPLPPSSLIPRSSFSKTVSRRDRDILTFPLLPAARSRRPATSGQHGSSGRASA